MRRSPRPARAVLRGEEGPLEARRHRRRARIRRRRHRALQRPAREVPERGALPHDARQPAGRLVLHQRCHPDAVRHLGAARVGPDQHARLDRRHRLPRARRPTNWSPTFKELTAAGFDLGGSGSSMRTPSCCVGQARCEWACYDTMATLRRPDAQLPGRDAPPAVPLQVQDQVLGLPERLRRVDCARGSVDHRDLEGRHPAGRRAPSPSTRRRASTSRRTCATAARPGA